MKRLRQGQERTARDTGPLRVLLAVLLALAPLLSIAQSMPLLAASGPVDSPTIEAGSKPPGSTEIGSIEAESAKRLADSSQMPCHGDALSAATHTAMHDGLDGADVACPHCTGDAAASSCQCCGQAAPAGLTVPVVETYPDCARAGDYVVLFPDSVPHTCNDRLYRPPIQSS